MNSFPSRWLCWPYSFLSSSFFLSNNFPLKYFGIWNCRLILSGRFVLCLLHSLSIWHIALGFSWTTREPRADQTPVAVQGLNPMVILGTFRLTTECWGTCQILSARISVHCFIFAIALDRNQEKLFFNLLFQVREPHFSHRFQARKLALAPCLSWGTLKFPSPPRNVFQGKLPLGFIFRHWGSSPGLGKNCTSQRSET